MSLKCHSHGDRPGRLPTRNTSAHDLTHAPGACAGAVYIVTGHDSTMQPATTRQPAPSLVAQCCTHDSQHRSRHECKIIPPRPHLDSQHAPQYHHTTYYQACRPQLPLWSLKAVPTAASPELVARHGCPLQHTRILSNDRSRSSPPWPIALGFSTDSRPCSRVLRKTCAKQPDKRC